MSKAMEILSKVGEAGVGPGTKLLIPKGYKTWFLVGEPPVASFSQDTEVVVKKKHNPYWWELEPVKGFPPKNIVGISDSDIGKKVKVVT